MRFAFIHNSFSFSCCFRLYFSYSSREMIIKALVFCFLLEAKFMHGAPIVDRRAIESYKTVNQTSHYDVMKNAPPLVFRIIHKIVNTPGFWPTSRPCKTMGQRQRRWFEWFRPKVSQPVLSTNRFSVSILLLTWLILCTIFVNKVTHDSRQEKKIIQTRLPS